MSAQQPVLVVTNIDQTAEFKQITASYLVISSDFLKLGMKIPKTVLDDLRVVIHFGDPSLEESKIVSNWAEANRLQYRTTDQLGMLREFLRSFHQLRPDDILARWKRRASEKNIEQ